MVLPTKWLSRQTQKNSVVFLVVVFSFILLVNYRHHFDTKVPDDNVWENLVESEIPNIVHYIHILPPPPPNDVGKRLLLEFEFRQFISFYSAYLYLRPDKIYVHTNAPPESIARARHSPNQWTYAIANLPVVEFRHVEAPTHTTAGKQLKELAHQADFVRTGVLKKMGGIYMDEDIYLLKDLSELRFAGFNNVVGREHRGGINNGMILSIPESDLVAAFDSLQDRVFDGGWSTHSIGLFTRLVSEFAARDYEVLIMDQQAFFPLDWETGIDIIYKMHEDEVPASAAESKDIHRFNLTTFVDSFQYRTPPTWHHKWDVSYALHGFNHILWDRQHLFGPYGRISLGYVLARNSNFARAVFPAIKHALDNGVIKIS